MSHWIYILYSNSADKYYVGETSDPGNRLKQHLDHHFKTNYTKIANDWHIKLEKEVTSKEDAVYLERFVKRMKSRSFIEKLIDNPTILEDILNKN
ncbi:GIY-YIG nuclease family protein [Sediminicola luteus]|uniref:GIY-YIG nuclease family protein n=1 Tax=Sediminicola luteus TaxID=319238 RepID=A0ABV2TYU3_9FLAO